MIRQQEILDQLSDHGGGFLFLNVFTRGELMQMLEESGILPACRGAGFSDLDLRLDTSDAFKHVLRVISIARADVALVELVLRSSCFRWSELGAATENLNMLVVEWVMLQNPGAAFTRERPRLPGQKHPGLRMGRNVVAFLLEMARALGADGVVEHPEYYHTGIMYSRTFRFLHPEAEGIQSALQRDLTGLSFAEAAWAVHQGFVREGRRTFKWVPEEQVHPLSDELRRYFESDTYRAAAELAQSRHAYRLARGKRASLQTSQK